MRIVSSISLTFHKPRIHNKKKVLETGYVKLLFLLHTYNLFSLSLRMEFNDVWLFFVCVRRISTWTRKHKSSSSINENSKLCSVQWRNWQNQTHNLFFRSDFPNLHQQMQWHLCLSLCLPSTLLGTPPLGNNSVSEMEGIPYTQQFL